MLSSTLYGKDKIRLYRVVREQDCHHGVEYNVSLLVQGDIQASYTDSDNSVVVATDSMKNITYYLAKVSPHILTPERFALHLASHVLAKYPHLHKAAVTIEQLRWSRIPIGTQPHRHSFYRDGDDKRFTKVEVNVSNGRDTFVATVTSGITDLLVLKSTGSSFQNFIRDEYTTLPEVNDRIFSTAVDLSYTFAPITLPTPTDDKKLVFTIPSTPADGLAGGVWDANGVAQRAREGTLEVFATDDSASVQATLYKMAQRVIAENARVDTVTYALPNKHYLPVDMAYIGVDNVSPANAEVFMPVAAPSGFISATVTRQ